MGERRERRGEQKDRAADVAFLSRVSRACVRMCVHVYI